MNDEDWSREMILANYLHYRGFDQQKIYEHLGRVHQSTISRWIGKGRARGLWSEHRVFDYERLLPEELAYVTDWENQHGLRKALIAWCDQYSVEPPETLVVDSGSTGSSRDAWAQRLRAFAREIDRGISKLISRQDVKVLGVGWGETLHHVLYGLSGSNPDLEVVPLCAELSRPAKVIFSSTVLAQGLSEAFEGRDKFYSLTGIAALKPEQDLEGSEAWRSIFGQRGAIHRMDMVIASASFAGKPFGRDMNLLAKTSGVNSPQIRSTVVGDIGGVLLPKRNKAKSDQFKALLKPWSGVNLEQLQAISQRAARRGTPGVVLCALGAEKASVVLEAIAHGVVQHLFLDEDLADEIANIVSDMH